MKRWIRWKGLIAFGAVLLAIVIVWVLVVDVAVRRTIEAVGTRAVGARVELAEADLSLFPTGLALTGLAVTNPDAPMQNIVEIGHMKMDIDPGYLIRRKVIIGDLLMEGLRFSTPRQRSGEVPKLARQRAEKKKADAAAVAKKAAEKVCGQFSMPSLSLPEAQAILAKESLTSLQSATELQQKLTAERARWEKEVARLADEKTLADYRARIDKLKGAGGSLGSLLGAAGDVQKLQADINKDLKLLKEAQTALTSDLKTYRQQVDALTRAPLEDINRLLEKYSLTPKGLANLSELIFGERLCAWIGKVADGYRRIKPYIAKVPTGKGDAPEEQKPIRGKGINIRFPETPPMPDFLIRNLKINADLAAGNLTGKAENITLDQHILGKPMTFALLGKQMQRMESLSLIGTANFVKPGEPKNDARLTVQGLGLTDVRLVKEESFPLMLKQATGNLNLKLATVANALDAAVNADFSGVDFDTPGGQSSTAISQAISSAIAGVDRFSLRADFAGTLEAYTVNVKSDLDKVLKSAVSNLVSAESAKLKSALQSRIDEQLKAPLEKLRGNLAGLEELQAELAKRLDVGDDLLKGLKLPF